MNRSTHIDMNEEVQKLIAKRERSVYYRAICLGDEGATFEIGNLQTNEDLWAMQRKMYQERKETPLDKDQVESLLAFVVDRETDRGLEDAEADNIAYDALGVHRILGKAKAPKKSGDYRKDRGR